MTQTAQTTINDITIGDDIDLTFPIANVPDTITFISAILTVKAYYSDTTALIQKTIGSVESIDGVIVGTELTFHLLSTDTVLLYPYAEYVFDVQVKTSENKVSTVVSGIIIAVRQVTTNG